MARTLAQISNLSGYYLGGTGPSWPWPTLTALEPKLSVPSSCPGADVYQDYTDVLDRDDVDAVIVATPDHWHAAISIQALRAGKAVFHEKPFSHTIKESQALVAAVRVGRPPVPGWYAPAEHVVVPDCCRAGPQRPPWQGGQGNRDLAE